LQSQPSEQLAAVPPTESAYAVQAAMAALDEYVHDAPETAVWRALQS
jgi:hypothetical protein